MEAVFVSLLAKQICRQTIGAFVSHMELHEAHVPYEIAWIDQVSWFTPLVLVSVLACIIMWFFICTTVCKFCGCLIFLLLISLLLSSLSICIAAHLLPCFIHLCRVLDLGPWSCSSRLKWNMSCLLNLTMVSHLESILSCSQCAGDQGCCKLITVSFCSCEEKNTVTPNFQNFAAFVQQILNFCIPHVWNIW